MKVINPPAILMFAWLFTMCSKSKEEKPPPDLLKGLMTYYEFNQHLYDSTGNLPALTATPDLNYGLDRHSNISSVNFAGGKLTVAVPNWKANPITISVWVFAHKDNVVKYFLGTNNGVIGLFQNNIKLGVAVSHPYTNSAMADGVNKTKWTHMTGIFDGKKIYTYINGVLEGSKEHPGEPKAITEITLGNIGNTKWAGVLDDLRIYNRVLSAEEIQLLARD